MKRLVIAVSSLIIALVICGAGFWLLNNTCDTIAAELSEIADCARANDINGAVKKTEEIQSLWEDAHGKIESLTQHSEVDELEEIIKILPVYAEQGNMERLLEKTETAIHRLNHIVKNETPLLSNIF